MPTLLMIGDKNTTVIGKDFAPADVKRRPGRYPELATVMSRYFRLNS
ncbi:hypothetical protein [Rhizobium sp. RCC_161_2]